MKKLLCGSILAGAAVAVTLLLPTTGQSQGYKAPRNADGHPNINGLWESLNTANWDIAAHSAAPGQLWQAGAADSEPAGMGIIEGGTPIPYNAAALAKVKANHAERLANDPMSKCFLPGVPRANYMPFPFEIVQSPNSKVILIDYEYDNAERIVNLGSTKEAPVDSWMGWSNGRWEGDTLVIDVTGLNDQSWFDRNGDIHSDKLHVIERWTPRSRDTMMYEATIEDPVVLEHPFKISFPVYRHVEQDARFLDFHCVPFGEELVFGKLRKPGVPVPAR